MRHVDEGTIHAWLDEQITDPAEAAWIEAHVRDCAECRARLADEQAAFDGARALLDGTSPSAERPSFDALVARAGRDVTDAAAPAAELTHRRRQRLVQLSWAASLALAVGLGWTARELTDRGATPSIPAPTIAQQPSSATDAPTGNAAPAEPPPTAGAVAPPARAAAAASPATAPQSRQAADAAAQRNEPRTQIGSTAPTLERGAAAAAADTVAELTPSSTLAAPTAAPPAAPPPAASAAQPIASPASLAASRLEAVSVADGQWRAVPRTEAAARTGMPLYGIDGLEPQYTGLSADGAVVRTLYRLESGQQLELVQQRNVPGAPPVLDLQSSRRALDAGRGGAVAQRPAGVPQPFTVVRGNMRLTLQTPSDAADLAALSLRLRVD